MEKYLLRIEGVNLANFVFDANDLSTIRGGGLLLLSVPDWVSENPPADIKLHCITQGASWGLFSFQADNDKMASCIVNETYKKLRIHPEYKHATIVVDAFPEGHANEYPKNKQRLEALNRWRQMQSHSIVPPHLSEDHEEKRPETLDAPKKKVCQFDHVRPAFGNTLKGDDHFDVSASVWYRREYGKKNKGRIWHEKQARIEENTLPEFVNDFNKLSMPYATNQDFGNLNGKMAVIYLDGNKFGERQRTFCTSAEKQEKFDKTIREKYQNGALQTLLEEIKEDQDWLNNGKLRFETLLWGGDEIIWVVPAWKGLWTLGRFYDHVVNEAQWQFPKGNPLTLAAGLVFCHHNAPINRITRLAKSLGDLAKHDRKRNLVAYQILESFDHAGVDIEEFRAQRCPPGIGALDLILNGANICGAIKAFARLKNDLPKRRLQQLVEELYRGKLPGEIPWEDLGKTLTILFPVLKGCFGQGHALWLHLLDLWDYIETDKSQGGDDVTG